MWDRHTPPEETMRALDDEVRGREDSLCRHLGQARLSNAHAAEPTTRIDPATLTEYQRTVAASVQAVAGELGVTPAQVAIAWTRTWSPAIHPIIGARRPGQLLDNLGAADLDLTDEAVAPRQRFQTRPRLPRHLHQ